jgi:hypothetical protein
MERQTNRHIQTAERNRRIASALIDTELASIQSAPYEWIAVIAFYAAVHYVNAYLWEARRYAPPDHPNRNHLVEGDPVLRRSRSEYGRLFATGFRARYVPNFRLPEQDARDLIERDLELVRQTVRGALGLPPYS